MVQKHFTFANERSQAAGCWFSAVYLTAIRRQVGDIIQIFNDYKEHADFLTVYVREAHPTDEWQMKSNVKEDVCYAQPHTLEQRLAIANDFTKRFKYPLPSGWMT